MAPKAQPLRFRRIAWLRWNDLVSLLLSNGMPLEEIEAAEPEWPSRLVLVHVGGRPRLVEEFRVLMG